MELSTESSETMLVISVAGRLEFATSGEFQRSLELAVMEANGRALVVDCTGLDYVSSMGLRCFLIGARTAQAVGIRFLVFGLQEFAAEVFALGGYSKVFPTLADRAAAEAAATA